MTVKHCKLALLTVILLTLMIYTGSYVNLSFKGCYEPKMIGLSGVKRYDWAPEGFVSEFKWDGKKMLLYYPLHSLDKAYFHSSDEAYSGRYPIHEVPQEEIMKVYQAWGLTK